MSFSGPNFGPDRRKSYDEMPFAWMESLIARPSKSYQVRLLAEDVLARRLRRLKDLPYEAGAVVYWMSRDQRASDNWALIYAAEQANIHHAPLCVVFCLAPEYLGATIRQYGFMLKGLQELEEDLKGMGIGFVLLEGQPETVLPSFLHENKAGLVITDFDPLRIKRSWKRRLAGEVSIPIHEIDAHNIVPCWLTSPRRIITQETFRARIIPMLTKFLTEFPPTAEMERKWITNSERTDWSAVDRRLKVDRSVQEVDWLVPGERAAKLSLQRFMEERLSAYPQNAHNPVVSGQSDLSPYLHLGQLSPQRVALKVRSSSAPGRAKSRFFHQLVVMRELSDNFVLHTPDYDTVGAFPEWARKSLDRHRSDPREHLYSLEDFETARTHDPLWNAAQLEMVKIGKIHGGLREYWAEKILEWTKSPEEAFHIAIYLNDRYELDGRDPSGYTGIAMVIGGLFGHPWRSKEVLGKVQRLTYTEMRLRYDVHAFQEKVKKL